MFSYQHHIGDFIRDTSNLTDSQMATYLRMIWMYYDTEKPLQDDCESIAFAVRSDEKTVRLLLRHFFSLQEDGWHHTRCDKEIQAYHAKSEKAKKNANARWKNATALRQQAGGENASACDRMQTHENEHDAAEKTGRNDATGMRPHCDSIASAHVLDANREPITDNRELCTANAVDAPKPARSRNPVIAKLVVGKPDDVSDQVWGDWLALRKTKKAPVTQTVVDGAKSEAAKAGISLEDFLRIWCTRGSQGLQASWIRQDELPGWVQRTPSAPPVIARRQAIEAHNQAVADQFLMGDEVFYDAE